MKKQICCGLAVLSVLTAGCGSGGQTAVIEQKNYIEYGTASGQEAGMLEAAQNDDLVLRIDRSTTDIELEQKSTGYIWSSRGGNPADSDGKILSFTYLDSSGAVATMDAAADSVAKGQYQIETISGGVRVTYSFGDIVKDLIYPSYISAKRFSEFTEKMTSRAAATVTPLYQHLAPGIYGDDIYADLLKNYPNAKGKDVYVLRNSDMLLNAKKELAAAFSDAGYTADDLKKDNEEFGVSGGIASSQSFRFNLSVEYVLEGCELIVRLPADSMYWSEQSGGIECLSLLPWFGAPSPESNGYFVLPDGSGAVMEFYNGSEHAGQVMYCEVYGENLSVTKEERIYDLEQTIFPVYGVKADNSGFLAVIEQGDAIARINAVSGTDTLSARAWADFNILDTQVVYAKSLAGAGDVAKNSYTKEQAEPYSGEIRLRYHFLSDADADYSGMARWYRSYLFPERKTVAKTVPFYLEAVCAVDYTKKQGGFSKQVVSTLTTFEEAGEMLDSLKEAGVSRQKLILSGWQKNGWRDAYANKAAVSDAAGGVKGLQELAKQCRENGVEFFPESDVQLVYCSALSGGIKKSLTSRTLVQQLTRQFDYSLNDFQKGAAVAYGMNSKYTADSISYVTNQLKGLGISSVALRYAAHYVIPDYKDGSVTDRQETVKLLSEAVSQAEESGMKLLSRTGNAPIAVLTDDIVELPLYSNGNYNCTYPIPFTAMVYSGNIEYASAAVNLSGDGKNDLLKIMEANAGVYYRLTARMDENLRSSDFHRFYSIGFEDHSQSAVTVYRTVAQALDGVYGQPIERHDRLLPNVYRTTFENGEFILTNYNDHAVTVCGIEIDANSYKRGKN